MKQKKNNSFINLWKKSLFGTSFGTGAKHEFTCCARELEWARWSGSTYLRGGQPPPAQISISHDWSYASHVWINILCLGGSRGGEEEGWAKLGCCLFRILWKYEGKFAILLVFHNYKICMRAVYIRCVRGVNSFMSECVRVCTRARARLFSRLLSSSGDLQPSASACKPLCQLHRFNQTSCTHTWTICKTHFVDATGLLQLTSHLTQIFCN